MNIFETLIDRVLAEFCQNPLAITSSKKPLDRTRGFWTFSVLFPDDYLISLAWNRYNGFLLTAGFDVDFGNSYDEIFSDSNDLFNRISFLVNSRKATEFLESVSLSDLRKLQNMTLSELARRVEMTKGGLSQLENGSDLLSMKVGTINKLIDSLGASLVLTARFPNGDERKLSIF